MIMCSVLNGLIIIVYESLNHKYGSIISKQLNRPSWHHPCYIIKKNYLKEVCEVCSNLSCEECNKIPIRNISIKITDTLFLNGLA